MRDSVARLLVTACTCAWLVATPRNAAAYSVLAHEGLVDAAWAAQVEPLLKAKYPQASGDALRVARAYAYGGSLIQDLGYYPFGSRFFSNLVHYVRSGDFVAALLRESRDVNEYAFALGALAHYAADNVGHPAVNRAVPILYPKLRREYGDEVLYAEEPERHLMAEFAFDVLQVARGAFKSDVYQQFIGFEVATASLARAFEATYGLTLTEVFGDVDLAIGTYRRAASQIVPDVTRLAWRDKREEILAAAPAATERDIVFAMSREEYDKTYGTNYRKPGLLARFLVLLSKLVPKIGPFRPLAFEPLTPAAERIFMDSYAASQARYRELLQAVRAGKVELPDTDFDTGLARMPGINALADETEAELAEALADKE